MANVTIPDLTALGANVAANDQFEISDTSNSDASRRVTQLQILQGLTITPAASSVLAIAASKTFTCSNTLTLAGTDSTVMTFPTTSATIARTDAANTFTGVQTMTSPSFTTSVVTGSTTLAVFNTTATTVNAFGAATTLNIGASAATVLNFGGHTSAAELRFLEPSGSGTNYSGLKQPALGTSITYLLPADAPADGDVLTAQDDGTLSWEPQSGAANAVTAASAAGGAGLLWVSGGADRTATATDTVSTVNAGTANVDVLKILDAVDQSHGLSFIVSSNLAADKTFTYTGAFNFTMTLSADTSVTFPTSGTLLASGGALGTPASGTLTNCTGLPASGIAAGVLGGNITLGESTGQIVLDPTLSADGTWSGIMQAGTAGATLAFGDLIYLAAADSRWELADADAASTSGDVVLGMCVLAAAADGDPTNVLLYGKIRADAAFPTLTVGAPAYAGTTAGDIQTAQPSGTDDVIRVVGYALTADVLLFNPAGFYITHT